MNRRLKKFLKFVAFVCIILLLVFGRGLVKKYVINRALGVYYVYKGDRAYHKHKLAYSIQYYNKGLDYFPEHYTAWFNLGNIYVVYEDYYSAVLAYQKAIEYNPRYTMARMNLGIIEAEKLGNFDEAIRQYDAILSLKNKIWAIPFLFSNKKSSKQNRGLAYYNRGLAYREKAMFLSDEDREMEFGLLRKAAESYEKSHRILRKNSDVVFNLALTYQIMGNYRDAGLNYCKAIALTPMNYEAHYNLAVLLRRLKRYKDAVDELEKASMLLSLKTDDTGKAVYVFGILSDASHLYSKYGANELGTNMDIYDTDNQDVNLKKKKKKKNPEDEDEVKNFNYSTGKIVPSEDLDKAMMKNFKVCAGMDYFKHEVEDDDDY